VRNLEPLRPLTALTALNLSYCAQVRDLEPLRPLTALTKLDLWGCKQVHDLEPLRPLTALTKLDLSYCKQVRNLEPLRPLTALTSLYLTGASAPAFTPLRPLLRELRELYVNESSFPDLPPCVCGERFDDNALAAVTTYFNDLDRGPEQDTELKVFVLGNGRVGKTKLVGRLSEIPFADIAEGSTHGVHLHTHPFPVPGLQVASAVELNLWDFGGQDIYHGTHALFIRSPAVYLLLWSQDCENDETVVEAGVEMKNRRLHYWFDYLRQEAGVKEGDRWVVRAPVLLIQNKCDRKADERDPPVRPEPDEFPLLYNLHVSAQEGRGWAGFVEALQEAIVQLAEQHPCAPLPASWVRVRAELRGMQATAAPTRTLAPVEFEQLCDRHGVAASAPVLRDVLHRTGVVFHRRGLFQDQVIVDQGWVLQAVYTVFTRHEEFQRLVRRNGRFTQGDLARYFWGKYSDDEQQTFLSFMEQCGICFRANPRSEAVPEYIAPELLPPWGAEHERRFRQKMKDATGAGVTATFSLLHDGILRGFLAKLGTRAGDRAEYWKFGGHFVDGATDSEALIRSDGNVLRLQAWDGRAAELLQTLVEVLQGIPTGQPPALAWDRPADEPVVVERGRSVTDPVDRIGFTYGPRSVFLSYRHPHPDHPDSRRSRALVEDLHARLTRDGWRVIWDQAELRDGDSISELIGRVKDCAFLVPVFCGRYLQSRYTLSEFLTFRQKFGLSTVEFSERTVAAVFPESGLESDFRRAEYVRGCRQLFERYREYAADLTLEPDTYREVYQLRGWAEHLAEVLAAVTGRLHNPAAAAVAALLNRRLAEKASS
jgi:internalin A